MRINRIQKMEAYILEHENVSISELCQHFAVSKNTVRRDLDELLMSGKIRKVYGGVTTAKKHSEESITPDALLSAPRTDSLKRMGQLAATLVSDNSWIFLDSGSTALEMIPFLAQKNGLTIVTHSLSVMYEAANYPSLSVFALGGMYDEKTSSYVGMSTVGAIDSMNIDMVFVVPTAISIEHELTHITYFEAEVKRSIVSSNSKIILLADHTKFDRNSVFTFGRYSQLSTVITDVEPSEEYLEVFRSNNIDLLIARK